MGQMLKTWMKWKHNFLVGFLPTTNSCHCTFRTISIVLCVFPLLFVQLVTVQGIQISSSTTSSIAQNNAAKVLKQILNVQFDKESEENLNLVRDDGKERFLWRVSSLNNNDKNVKGDTSSTTPRVESSSPGEEMGPLRIFKYVTGDEDNHRHRQGGGRSISMQQMKSSSENKRSNGAVNASGKIKSNGASVTSSMHTDPKAAPASVTDRSLIRNSYFEAPTTTNKKKNEPQNNFASESPMPVNKMNHSITSTHITHSSSNKSSNSKSSVVHVQYHYNNNHSSNYDNNVGVKVNVKDIPLMQEKVTPKSEVLINGTISERPRRSPFHRYPPLKMVAVGPNPRQGPRAHLYHRGGHPNPPNRHVPVPMHKMRPPPPHAQKYPQLPVPVPYTSNNDYMSHGSDFFGGNNNFNDPSGNQQDSTFNNFMFSKPRTFQRPQQSNNPRNRNAPAGRRGRPTNNVSQGVPLPRPMRHPSRNRSKRPRPSKNQGSPYQYPKNAENIQDILSFFDKENEVDGPGPRGKGPPGPSHGQGQIGQGPPGGPLDRPTSSDFSKELRDVQSSLLKDIREFAKRPSMMSMSQELPISPNQHQQHSPSPSSSSSISSSPFNSIMHDDQDAMEELFDPKPKPVRDMVKSGSRNRDRDREEERERRDREREREREREYQRQLASKNSQKSRMRYQPPVVHDEESKERYREERPRNRPNRHQHTSTESSRYNNRDRSKENNYNRESNTKSRNKYKEQDPFSFEDHDRYRDFPTRDFPNRDFPSNYRDRDSDEYRQKSPSKSPYRSTNKPVVLKRPFESSMMDMEFPSSKQKRPNDFDNYYAPFGGGNSPESYRIKPSGSHSVAKASSLIPGYNAHFGGLTFRPYTKPASPEIEEDIVEIHTGPHNRNNNNHHHHGHHNVAPNYHDIIAEREREKQMNMQKLYMDFLQQKMQAEAQAALINQAPPPTSPPKKTKPMRMKIHIYPNEGSSGSESTMTPNIVHPNPGLHTSNFAIANNPNFHVGGFSASNPNVMSISPRDKNVQMYSYSTNPNTHRTLMLPGPGPAPPIQPHYGMSENHNINLNHHNSHSNSNNNNNNNQGSAGMGVDKNKNVVLHLHVHRRNGAGSGAPLELEAEASELHPVSVKPLSYKDIYDEREDRDNREDQRQQQQQQQENDQEHDKSVSMEVPIHDDKIDDVLQTLLKLRDKQEGTKEEN